MLSEFQRTFHVHFRSPQLLKLALTHRSYLHVTGAGPRDSNERLEYLGDSVLGLVTSEFLYRSRPDEHEGQLTKTKSLLVSKAILSRRALAMRLGRYVLMSHSEMESGGRQRLSILADAFEAVIGAIYLDQGFEAARAFIDQWLLREARVIVADKRHTNYKSHLQEYVQSTFRTHPVYRIRSAMGPDHSKQFMVEVLVGRRVLGEGRGQNKKDAEQAAARDALDRVGHTPRDEREAARPAGREEHESVPSAPREEPRPAPVRTADVEDEDDEESVEERRRRRRGRRGGRGRRDREGDEAPRPAPPAVSGPPPAPPPPPPAYRSIERGGRSVPRPHAPGAPTGPMPPAPAFEDVPQSRFRPQLEEDEHEEVGRPEGPAHESDLAARTWPTRPAGEPRRPAAPEYVAPRPREVSEPFVEIGSEPVAAPEPVEDAWEPAVEEPQEDAWESEADEPESPAARMVEEDEHEDVDTDTDTEPARESEPESESESELESESESGGFIEMEPEVPGHEPPPASPTTSAPPPPAPSFGRRPGRVRKPFRR